METSVLTTPLEALTAKETKFLNSFLEHRCIQTAAKNAGMDHTDALMLRHAEHFINALDFCNRVAGNTVYTDKSKVTRQLAQVAVLAETPVLTTNGEDQVIDLNALKAVSMGVKAIEDLSKIHGWNAPKELALNQHITKGLDDQTLQLLGGGDEEKSELPLDVTYIPGDEIFE